MTPRLNVILKTCSKNKLRKGYIKYLNSLDFDEFKYLFYHYTTITIRLMYRYKDDNPKIFSKKWIRNILLRAKYDNIKDVFNEANLEYVDKMHNDLIINNKRKTELIAKLTEINNTLKNLRFSGIPIKSAKDETIVIFAYAVDVMYMNQEFKRILEEIDNIE